MRAVSHYELYSSERFAAYVTTRRRFGDAVAMTEAQQPPGDMSDPPTTDLVLVQAIRPGFRHRSDFGAGRFTDIPPANGLFLIPPGVSSDIRVETDHAIRCFAFDAAHFRGAGAWSQQMPDGFDFGRLHRECFLVPTLIPVLQRMWSVGTSDAPRSALYAQSAAHLVLAELSLAADRKSAPLSGGLAPRHLRRITDYLDAHLALDVSLADLAALVGLSPAHLCRAFKQTTGLPPHRWRLARRIERACALLAETDLPVTEIAAAVGYDDPSQLAAAFRSALGTSPSRYRRERRG